MVNVRGGSGSSSGGHAPFDVGPVLLGVRWDRGEDVLDDRNLGFVDLTGDQRRGGVGQPG